MVVNIKDLYYLASEAKNYFMNLPNQSKGYTLTCRLVNILKEGREIDDNNLNEWKRFLNESNLLHELQDSDKWLNIREYIENKDVNSFTVLDALLPALLHWQFTRFNSENFINRYKGNFENFVGRWANPIGTIFNEIKDLTFYSISVNIFKEKFEHFENLLRESHSNNINEPVMIAKILHFLNPDVFTPFDNPIMDLLGLSKNSEGFAVLNIWVFNFKIRNIIVVKHLEDSIGYPFTRIIDMILWAEANNKIQNPAWKQDFYNFIVNYLLNIR